MYLTYNRFRRCAPYAYLSRHRARSTVVLSVYRTRQPTAKLPGRGCDGHPRERERHRIGGCPHGGVDRRAGRARPDRAGAEPGRGAGLATPGQAPPMDALHAARLLCRRGRPGDSARRGLLRLRRKRQALPRRAIGAVLREHRPRARRAGRGGGQAGQGARLLHELELCASAFDRAGDADRRPRAGQSQPRVLHLRRVGVRGVRVEARQGLSPCPRRAHASQAGLAQARLPRLLDGGLDCDRADADTHAVRTADPGRNPRGEHELVSLAGRPRPAVGG